MAESPFFSIGITTYDRQHLLKYCLESVLSQTYSDYEVIVGNDCTEQILSPELLGINDPRIRFVNHPQNLGQLRNMNALLGMARGKYFTWQFDDDFYAADFLEKMYRALARFKFPLCSYSSYKILYDTMENPDCSARAEGSPRQMRLFSAREFLRMYLPGKLRALGLCGVYDTQYLQRLGGVEALSESQFALYSEYLLLVRAGLLDRIAYIDTPLLFYRVHAGSWGSTTMDLDLLKQAGINLVQKSIQVLSDPALQHDYEQNVFDVLKLVFCKFVERCSMRRGTSGIREAMAYMGMLNKCLYSLTGSDFRISHRPGIREAILWGMGPFLQAKFKLVAPSPLLKIAYKCYSYFRQRGWTSSIP